jgi:hypothetical protein
MTPEQRREFEAQPAGNRRPQALLRRAGANKIIRELTPSELVEDEWFPKTFDRLREYQKTVDPELKEMLSKTDMKPDAPLAKQKAQDPIEKFRRVRIQRSAVNLYYLNQPPPRSVDPQRLTQFLAAMPPWIRATFNTYPADEARRRLTLVYRLVFPYPNEFNPVASTGSKTTPAPAVNRSTVPPAPAPISKPDRAPLRSPASGTPF